MDRIKSLRKDIDEIDEQILHFLKTRIEICRTIGVIKRERNIPIRDREREEEQCRNLMKKAAELGLNPLEVKSVYQEIIAMGMHVQ